MIFGPTISQLLPPLQPSPAAAKRTMSPPCSCSVKHRKVDHCLAIRQADYPFHYTQPSMVGDITMNQCAAWCTDAGMDCVG